MHDLLLFPKRYGQRLIVNGESHKSGGVGPQHGQDLGIGMAIVGLDADVPYGIDSQWRKRRPEACPKMTDLLHALRNPQPWAGTPSLDASQLFSTASVPPLRCHQITSLVKNLSRLNC